MKYLGSVTDPKDVVNKEYVDSVLGSSGVTVDALIALLSQGNNITIEKSNGKVKISSTDTDTITRVKGNAESTYRTGNVNLTPANIGAAASNHEHDSRYYTETEVDALLGVDALKEKLGLNPVSVALDSNSSNVPSGSSVTCTYIPALSRCFFRGYLAERSSRTFSSGTSYTLWTIPEGYRPSTRHALAITNASSTRVDAFVTSSGIQITPRGDTINRTNLIYITGWWGV